MKTAVAATVAVAAAAAVAEAARVPVRVTIVPVVVVFVEVILVVELREVAPTVSLSYNNFMTRINFFFMTRTRTPCAFADGGLACVWLVCMEEPLYLPILHLLQTMS